MDQTHNLKKKKEEEEEAIVFYNAFMDGRALTVIDGKLVKSQPWLGTVASLPAVKPTTHCGVLAAILKSLLSLS